MRLQPRAELEAVCAGDGDLHDREVRPTLERRALRLRRIESDDDLVTLCGEEQRSEVGGEGVALGEQDQQALTVLWRGLVRSGLFSEQTVRGRRRKAARQLALEEPKLLDLPLGVQPVATWAAARRDESITLLPVAHAGRRDADHALDRTDGVDRPFVVGQRMRDITSSAHRAVETS